MEKIISLNKIAPPGRTQKDVEARLGGMAV